MISRSTKSKHIENFNNDVVLEILLHLPVQSLLRFRAVSKFWRDVIDSPSFRKLHTNNNNEDDTVYLKLDFLDKRDEKLSIKLLDNGMPLQWYNDDHFNDFQSECKERLVRAVKGLICIGRSHSKKPIAICNPFLGQLKILPKSPHFNSCNISTSDVGIGFDGEDYKVVELLVCSRHGGLHAQLYSRRADSWRDLGGVLDKIALFIRPVKSLCKNGYFAHWGAIGIMGEGNLEDIILSFDMKREVFQEIGLGFYCGEHPKYYRSQILAKDGCSFIRLLFPSTADDVSDTMGVCESRFEDGKLVWDHVVDVTRRPSSMPLWRSDCVVFRNFYEDYNELIFYDHRARELIGSWEVSESSEIVEYKGSLISP